MACSFYYFHFIVVVSTCVGVCMTCFVLFDAHCYDTCFTPAESAWLLIFCVFQIPNNSIDRFRHVDNNHEDLSGTIFKAQVKTD